MTPAKNWITVRFDVADKGKIKFGGLELLRADRWVIQEDDGYNGGTKTDVQRDKRITNPQQAVVTGVCDGSEFKPGDQIFTHFLAYETAQWPDDETALIKEHNILFAHRDGELIPVNVNFFGEEVYTEPERTPSGIYVSTQEKVKEATRVLITHVPEKNSGIKKGDTVVTIDANQYVFTFNGTRYIKLVRDEIIGKIVDEQQVAA